MLDGMFRTGRLHASRGVAGTRTICRAADVSAGRLTRPLIERLEERRLLAAPVLETIPAQTIPIGKTVQIPLRSSDADGDTITYTATTGGGAAVTPFVRPRDGTFLRMDVRDFGAMEFQLFDANAPDTVRRIVGLANSGFYDGLTFHRVVDDFVIQGGDPAGDGTGDTTGDGVSDTPQFIFDDEFNNSNLFTQSGTLAMANRGKDTNGSQFFITTGAQRFLDFNHTIFGQLVRGFQVLTSINAVPTDANGRPADPVVIETVSVVDNQTDGVLQLRANGSGAGTVTVRATDQNGQFTTQTFAVTPQADTVNSPPILARVENQRMRRGGTLTLNLDSTDLENDAVEYAVDVIDPTSPRDNPRTTDQLGTATVSGSTVTYTPPANYQGAVDLLVGVRQQGATSRGSTENPFDTQRVRIGVGDQNIGVSGVPLDSARDVPMINAVVATFVDENPDRNATSFVADVDWGDGTVSRGTAQGVTVRATRQPATYEVVASHTYSDFVGRVPTTITVTGNKGFQATAVARTEVRPLTTLDAPRRILFVHGTSGDDIAGMTGNPQTNTLRTNYNGVIEDVALDAVGRIEMYFYAGHDYGALGGGVTDTYMFGDTGDDTLYGGNGNDTISGGAGKNFLYGVGGNNRLQGSNGRDFIIGGPGDDRIYGDLDRDLDTDRGGNDTIFGGGGKDRIWGGAGDDYIEGGPGNDPIRAGRGNDTLLGNRGRDILDGGPGNNVTLRSDLDDPDELSGLLLTNVTIVDELDRIQPFFAPMPRR